MNKINNNIRFLTEIYVRDFEKRELKAN